MDCHSVTVVLLSHNSVCDNVYRSLTMFSALAAVCTVVCAIEIVITLHYITLHYIKSNGLKCPRQYALESLGSRDTLAYVRSAQYTLATKSNSTRSTLSPF